MIIGLLLTAGRGNEAASSVLTRTDDGRWQNAARRHIEATDTA
ncbi:hypothetical protein [Burkholderia ambifaria]|nr:hypothetical protein [Burkholderia ambifaria]